MDSESFCQHYFPNLRPGEHDAELLACLENSDIEGYVDDEINSDSERENFENNENFTESADETT
jgi:hypothetical protein